MSAWDVIVVGAGPNGLTAAAVLAKAGRKVLILERRERTGGRAAAEDLGGAASHSLLPDTTGVRPWVIRDLELEKHGLRLRPEREPVLVLGEPGESLLVPGEAARADESLGADAEAFRGYRNFLSRIAPVLHGFLDESPVNLVDVESMGVWSMAKKALRIRRLGTADMMELLRLPPMCVADGLDEWFASPLLKLALAVPAVGGSWTGPRSPGTNFNLMLHEAAAGPGVEGGAPALVAALRKCAEAAGATVRTGATVDKMQVEGGKIRGVVLQGGEEITTAAQVAAACDPVQLFRHLMPLGAIDERLRHRIDHWRIRGTTAQVLLALRERPRFTAAPDGTIESVIVGGSMTDLERAFDAVKYRRVSEVPVLELRVPPGPGVLSALVHYAPHDLEAGWDAAARGQLADRVVELLERQAPGFSGLVSDRKVLAPADLEADFGLTGGHLHHGEHALDQLLIRPIPECSRYGSPVGGLFLCGAGTHPGGWLTCANGAHAAAAILGRA